MWKWTRHTVPFSDFFLTEVLTKVRIEVRIEVLIEDVIEDVIVLVQEAIV